MIKQVSAGKNSVLCIGISTGLTVMDEQRQALEKRISDLEYKQVSGDSKVRDGKSKGSVQKRAKEDFRKALFDTKSDHSKIGTREKSQKSSKKFNKSGSSVIMKSSSSKIHAKIQNH